MKNIIHQTVHTTIIIVDDEPKKSNYLVSYSAIVPGLGLKVGTIRAKDKTCEMQAAIGVKSFLNSKLPLALSVIITEVKKEA